MEGVRLTCGELIDMLERGLKRVIEDLAEALDRTPYTISSRQLIEGALKLSQGLYNTLRHLREECVSREGSESP